VSAAAYIEAVSSWTGHAVDRRGEALLAQYAQWLLDEAIPAGGLGPREAVRLWPRHLADSLVFSVGWEQPPTGLLDVGSGVGMPGIPLAILWPDTEVTLLDRGGRRITLLERVIRLLGLGNATVMHRDVSDVGGGWAGAVWRGSVPLPRSPRTARKLLAPGASAVVGLSRRRVPPDATAAAERAAASLELESAVIDVPDEILDGPAWLLIMTRCSVSPGATC